MFTLVVEPSQSGVVEESVSSKTDETTHTVEKPSVTYVYMLYLQIVGISLVDGYISVVTESIVW